MTRKGLVLLGGSGLLLVVGPWLWFRLSSGALRSPGEAPRRHVALVLGAGILDGRPSRALDERIRAAVSLYELGRVEKLVMSGDNSRTNYDEVSVMKDRAVELGVPDGDVLLDFAGFSTEDSCVRIRKVFGQSEILVVSQRFHLPRAVHLCHVYGVRAVGVGAADSRPFVSRAGSALREVAAAWKAFVSADLLHRGAKVLGPAIDVDNPSPEALHQPLDAS